MSDHELVTAANLRKVPIVLIFGMRHLICGRMEP
jgi:hypothetical protein